MSRATATLGKRTGNAYRLPLPIPAELEAVNAECYTARRIAHGMSEALIVYTSGQVRDRAGFISAEAQATHRAAMVQIEAARDDAIRLWNEYAGHVAAYWLPVPWVARDQRLPVLPTVDPSTGWFDDRFPVVQGVDGAWVIDDEIPGLRRITRDVTP